MYRQLVCSVSSTAALWQIGQYLVFGVGSAVVFATAFYPYITFGTLRECVVAMGYVFHIAHAVDTHAVVLALAESAVAYGAACIIVQK